LSSGKKRWNAGYAEAPDGCPEPFSFVVISVFSMADIFIGRGDQVREQNMCLASRKNFL
jgi:hypothetical protein